MGNELYVGCGSWMPSLRENVGEFSLAPVTRGSDFLLLRCLRVQ